ncbi:MULTISPECIES: class I SAM-dependent methyltransferase [unclassified Roseofilum]|uniref:class I SAM-dependent methyltransferase n=1 Tax=unclassified Roseofilum TaxID=2620099 RepID=UPI000E8D6701|nr:MULTISPECIES: class I SAM-dependent methyltransferase [unclassified Roseofilum]HBR00455.1 hypothetical protein [Cyanobacteria bacterium UBA11691]MBP0008673.1 class I SAM-dependent methyltransferase [Roseofilum sp. Belize Diploria]MBP0012567.1 class I SAM-dependent methyltransferase [Roseofilum sp. SID3]MBP0025465.1 class I SAM-dependent methyltransferase [Roseofilum sp. SID2]MBP0033082.1 class I SAM-dependent methyltransferase [Roseofilum sp. Belize BBD 4]
MMNSLMDFDSEPVGTLKSLQKSAVFSLFSDQSLKLLKLNEQQYIEGQIAYRNHHNEELIILEEILNIFEQNKSQQPTHEILSIGCGQGLFEKLLLKSLISENKIHFVGVDPNETACSLIQKECQVIYTSEPAKLSFDIHQSKFEDLVLTQKFDLVLLIQSLLYFSDIETVICKVYECLAEGGMAIIAIPAKRQLLNEPYYQANYRLYGEFPCYSEELKKYFNERNLSFVEKRLQFLVNITQCFEPHSEVGKHLLNFMLGVNIDCFSPLQLRLILDYFGTSSQKIDSGEVVLPHSVDIFHFQK